MCIKTCPFNITTCNKTNKITIWEKYTMTKKANDILNDVMNNHQILMTWRFHKLTNLLNYKRDIVPSNGKII